MSIVVAENFWQRALISRPHVLNVHVEDLQPCLSRAHSFRINNINTRTSLIRLAAVNLAAVNREPALNHRPQISSPEYDVLVMSMSQETMHSPV